MKYPKFWLLNNLYPLIFELSGKGYCQGGFYRNIHSYSHCLLDFFQIAKNSLSLLCCCNKVNRLWIGLGFGFFFCNFWVCVSHKGRWPEQPQTQAEMQRENLFDQLEDPKAPPGYQRHMRGRAGFIVIRHPNMINHL